MNTMDGFKSFWQRSEGTLGLWVLAALVVGAGLMGWNFVLPWILGVLANTLKAVLYAIILAALIAIGVNRQFHLVVIYWFKMLMQLLATGTVALNKVGVLKVYERRYAEMLDQLDGDIERVHGELQSVDTEITDTQGELNEALSEIGAAEERGQSSPGAQRRAARRKKSGEKYLRIKQGIEGLYVILCSYRQACSDDLEDVRDEIKDETRTLRVTRLGSSAIRRMKQFIEQRGDDRAFYDMALESVKRERDARLGEIGDFLRRTRDVMQRVDLRHGMMEDEGLKLYEEWKKDPNSLVLGSSKAALVARTDNTSAVLDLTAAPADVAIAPVRRPSVERRDGRYDDFFRKSS